MQFKLNMSVVGLDQRDFQCIAAEEIRFWGESFKVPTNSDGLRNAGTVTELQHGNLAAGVLAQKLRSFRFTAT